MPGDVICDDVLRWAEAYTGSQFHAMLCDPPYSLGDGTRGFMGKQWDTDIAFRPATWQALAQHLLPGAFIMAFASSRGYHRLACALEDAGLVLHPTIFLWAYGSGFPKATRVEDERFAGHRYGGQVLKPSAEPIIVAQVPYRGRPVDSITTTGAGSLWIDGARVSMGEESPRGSGHRESWRQLEGRTDRQPWHGGNATPSNGRWPPNLALVHLPTCRPVGTRRVQGTNIPGPGVVGLGYHGIKDPHGHINHYTAPDGTETVQAYACDPECPVFRFDRQAGERSSGAHAGERTGIGYHGGGYGRNEYTANEASTGPASRFFPCFDWALDVAEQLAQADPVFYTGKASRSERNEGLASRNTHCSIKPISLCTWLATLLLPPAAYAPRRLLVPFSGTSSEMIGAVLAGWDDVLGIEQDAQYVATGKARLTYWDTQIAAQLSLF
jgi:hypothetical protein